MVKLTKTCGLTFKRFKDVDTALQSNGLELDAVYRVLVRLHLWVQDEPKRVVIELVVAMETGFRLRVDQ